jgi:isocitrate lyase
MGVETLVVARTDAEAATLLDGYHLSFVCSRRFYYGGLFCIGMLLHSNIDARDHPFIIGTTNPDLPALNDVLADAARKKVTLLFSCTVLLARY